MNFLPKKIAKTFFLIRLKPRVYRRYWGHWKWFAVFGPVQILKNKLFLNFFSSISKGLCTGTKKGEKLNLILQIF
jgi:hypothetical protein